MKYPRFSQMCGDRDTIFLYIEIWLGKSLDFVVKTCLCGYCRVIFSYIETTQKILYRNTLRKFHIETRAKNVIWKHMQKNYFIKTQIMLY